MSALARASDEGAEPAAHHGQLCKVWRGPARPLKYPGDHVGRLPTFEDVELKPNYFVPKVRPQLTIAHVDPEVNQAAWYQAPATQLDQRC